MFAVPFWTFSRTFCQSSRGPAGLPEDGEGQEGAGELQQVGHDVRHDLPGQVGVGQRDRAEPCAVAAAAVPRRDAAALADQVAVAAADDGEGGDRDAPQPQGDTTDKKHYTTMC